MLPACADPPSLVHIRAHPWQTLSRPACGQLDSKATYGPHPSEPPPVAESPRPACRPAGPAGTCGPHAGCLHPRPGVGWGNHNVRGRREGSAVTTDTRRVIAGVHGSVRSLAALHVAAAEARAAGAVLLPVLAWSPVGGEAAYRRAPCRILLRVWEDTACKR